MKLYRVAYVFIAFLLAGCNFDNYVIMPKKDWEAEKAAIEKKYGEKANQVIAEIEKKRAEKEAAEKDNLQKAAGLAYGILQLSEVKPEPERTRPDTLINYKSKELVSRLPNLPVEEILKINEELKKELDEKTTSLLELQKKYNEALKQAEVDKKAIAAIQEEILNKRGELNKIQKDLEAARLEKEREQRKAAELEADKQRKEKEDAQKREEIIKYLIKIFIGIGVLAAVGAYALRSVWMAAASAGAFGLSVFIAFVEPWIIIAAGVAIIVCVLAGIGVKLYHTNKEKMVEQELSNRLVGSIEEAKNRLGVDRFKKEMAPIIDEWIKDMPQLKGKIEDKLKELNLK